MPYFTVNRSIVFTSLFNASGHPAASLPLHWSAQALPVGLQIIAQFGDEATIFRLTAQIETTRPWKGSSPTLDGLIPWSLARRGRYDAAPPSGPMPHIRGSVGPMWFLPPDSHAWCMPTSKRSSHETEWLKINRDIPAGLSVGRAVARSVLDESASVT
jgi:Amidase